MPIVPHDLILMIMIGLLVVIGFAIYMQLDKLIDLLMDGVAYRPHQGESNESHRPHL